MGWTGFSATPAIGTSNYMGCAGYFTGQSCAGADDADGDGTIDIQDSVEWRGIMSRSREKVSFRDITDGSSNTVLFGESTMGTDGSAAWASIGSQVMYWTPDTPNGELGTYAFAAFSFNSRHTGGVQYTLGDGSVRFISDNTSKRIMYLLAAMQDGKVIGEF